MPTKQCLSCHQTKELSLFSRNCRKGDGREIYCKVCSADRQRDYAKRNPIKYRLQRRAWRLKNKERFSSLCRASAVARKDILAQGAKLHKSKFPFKHLAVRAVARALSRGELKRQPCCICGIDKAQAHHVDYAQPLDVTWLCGEHHAAWHRVFKSVYNGEIYA